MVIEIRWEVACGGSGDWNYGGGNQLGGWIRYFLRLNKCFIYGSVCVGGVGTGYMSIDIY